MRMTEKENVLWAGRHGSAEGPWKDIFGLALLSNFFLSASQIGHASPRSRVT